MSQATAAAKYAIACKNFDMEIKTASVVISQLRREIRNVNGLSTPLSFNDGDVMDNVISSLFAQHHADKVVKALALKLQAELEWEEARCYSITIR